MKMNRKAVNILVPHPGTFCLAKCKPATQHRAAQSSAEQSNALPVQSAGTSCSTKAPTVAKDEVPGLPTGKAPVGSRLPTD
eukprot:1489108-Alexandrium_andersonii.AAC.1